MFSFLVIPFNLTNCYFGFVLSINKVKPWAKLNYSVPSLFGKEIRSTGNR